MSEIRQLRPDTEQHAVVAEQMVLGAIMNDNGLYDRVSDLLGQEHFVDPLHAHIFGICASRITRQHLASAVALGSILEDNEQLRHVGGPQYLIRLAGSAVASSMIRDYAKLIIEHSCRRALRQTAQDALQALDAGEEAQNVRAALSAGLYALPEVAGQESSVGLDQAMARAMDAAVKSYQGEAAFLRTGVPALDKIVRLGPGDVMLLGGATSMGKTSLATHIAANVAAADGKVGFWSLEMDEEQLATRLASASARVPYAALRDAATMSEDDFRKWIEAGVEVAKLQMRIVPRHIRDIAAGHAAFRRMKRDMGALDLAVIDYAQLVRGQGKSRFEQMTEVSIGIKTLAKLLECPVIALVQLSRDIGMRDDKRPQLSDIKETGQFENDADQVVFCHREAYWMERQGVKPGRDGKITEQAQLEFETDLAALKNVMQLIVRKNRHGRCATAEVGFHDATNRFWELQHNNRPEDFE